MIIVELGDFDENVFSKGCIVFFEILKNGRGREISNE